MARDDGSGEIHPGAGPPAAGLSRASTHRRRVRCGDGEDPGPIDCNVLCSAGTGRSYLCTQTLVHEKPHVVVVLALVLREDKACPSLMTSFSTDVVIIKVINRYFIGVDPVEDSYAEVAALQAVARGGRPAKGIMPLLEAMEDEQNVYIVTAWGRGGDLFGLMSRNPNGLPEEVVANFLVSILDGLESLREAGYAHRDLSLENIVLRAGDRRAAPAYVCHLIDLGMCTRQRPEGKDGRRSTLMSLNEGRRGKPGYVAPEVLVEPLVDGSAADMWSVGVILYIMLTGHPIYSSPADWAFSALARGQLQQLMAFYAAQYGLGVPPLAFDLLAALLDAEPSRRPTLEMVRVHPWVLAHTPGLEHRAADGAPQPAA